MRGNDVLVAEALPDPETPFSIRTIYRTKYYKPCADLYYEGEEILACETVGITVTLPKPMTSSAKAAGRFGKQDFIYVAVDDVYRCPAGERLTYRYTNEDDGKTLRRYWTTACQACALKAQCTPGKERRISRWQHEAVLETVQDRLDRNPTRCGCAARPWSIRSGPSRRGWEPRTSK